MLIPLLACLLACSVENTEKCGCYLHSRLLEMSVDPWLACLAVQVFCKRCSLHLEGRSSKLSLLTPCVQFLLKHELLHYAATPAALELHLNLPGELCCWVFFGCCLFVFTVVVVLLDWYWFLCLYNAL